VSAVKIFNFYTLSARPEINALIKPIISLLIIVFIYALYMQCQLAEIMARNQAVISIYAMSAS